ncbi:MAG: TIR domain-containing protein [Eubacteriales bacterium]
MSAEQTRKSLNQLDNELADLEKKLAELAKKEADKTKRINDTQKGITKNTSASMASSKRRQIQGYQNELARIIDDKAGINKKIAEKRKKRADTTVKLQREETAEMQKANKIQKSIQSGYERRIADLSAQITKQLSVAKPPHHLYEESSHEEYDVFISHASEDKAEFADTLCKELESSGVKVWYDALSIVWGDSLRTKIDDGLKKSHFGIVILSKDYIHKGWTQYELDGLFQIEMTNGKTILPIWHNITKDEVQAFSPTLAGRKALNTSMFSAREIADELIKILPDTSHA